MKAVQARSRASPSVASRRSRDADASTAGRLVEAAMEEFRRHGYFGTDSNKIARRAGFAPQTFYRWFEDKTGVFLAAYERWQDEERCALDQLLAARAPTARLVEAVIAHHRDYRQFRRSLRQLAVEDDAVRQARAQSRMAQIEHIRERFQLPEARRAALATVLLQVERLADAVAEGEFDDLGTGDAEARRAMARLVEGLPATAKRSS